jgi:Flp pilus assembly protein TadD
MTLTSSRMDRASVAGKSLLLLLAVGISVAGCTSLSSYEPGTRATSPATTSSPSGRTPTTSTTRPDAGAAMPRGEASRPVASERSNQPKAPRENAASAVLLEQSRDERAAGSYAEAAISIERALRIDPNNPALWIELAEIKSAEGDLDQAEMMARKALTLAGSDRSIEERAERLLSR